MENPNFSPYFYTLRCGFNRFYIKIHLKVTIKHRVGSQKASLVNGADTLGLTIPYICYFKINTHDLTDNSQLDYLSEIVKLAKERGMAIRVIGAADSATGTADLNQRLSEDRDDYISDSSWLSA